MATQQGIYIAIKAFIPYGKSINAQFKALSAAKLAHETGDYAELVRMAQVEDVKVEPRTRRVPDGALGQAETPAQAGPGEASGFDEEAGADEDFPEVEMPDADVVDGKATPDPDEDAPRFLSKRGRSAVAAE